MADATPIVRRKPSLSSPTTNITSEEPAPGDDDDAAAAAAAAAVGGEEEDDGLTEKQREKLRKEREKQEKKDIKLALQLQKEETGQIEIGESIDISRPGGQWVRGVAVAKGKKKTHFICRFEENGKTFMEDFSRKALRPIVGARRQAPAGRDEDVMLETLREAILAGMDPMTMGLSPEVLRQLGYHQHQTVTYHHVGGPAHAHANIRRPSSSGAGARHVHGYVDVEPDDVDCRGELVDMGIPPFQDVETVIPLNAYPGAAIELRLPSGDRTRVSLPPNVQPGQRVTLRVPSPEPDFQLVSFVVPYGKRSGSTVTVGVPGRAAPFRVEVSE
jgi:hypothetical protein